jgi:lipid A 3-O-deacylase
MRFLATLVLFCSSAAIAQTSKPLDGHPWDLGIWGSGGFSVPGGTKDTQMMNVGVRFGKVLTSDHGGSFLRGNFEWSADVIPVYYFWQPAPAKNAYAAGFNPVNLTWNFTSFAKTVPYLELGGGVLFSDGNVPANTNQTNFLTHAALGFHFFVREKRALTVSTRYEHISNAGLATPNPGINSVQFALGWHWLK